MYRGTTIHLIRFVSVLAVLSMSALFAQAQTFSGRATGINATITAGGSSSTTVAGDTCPLPAEGGTIVMTTPGTTINGVLATGTMISSTSGAGNSSQASSTVNNLILNAGGYYIRATTLTANTQCNCCIPDQPECSGTSEISNLSITDPAGNPVKVTVDGSANQVINLPGGVGTLTLNEQIHGPGEITVNALRVNVTIGGTTTNVVVASAHSDIVCVTGGPTNAKVSVSGSVVDSNGRALSRVTLTLTDPEGVAKTTQSGPFGSFVFTDVLAGHPYELQATLPGYTFEPKVIMVTDEVTGIRLTPNP